MEIKNILSKFRTTKDKQEKTFFSLQINHESLSSAVWTVRDERAVIIKMGSMEEWSDKDSFLQAAQQTLTNAQEGITPAPQELIFGLPDSWVEGQNVEQERKRFLRELCENLSLKPVGFVVTVEALIEYLKVKEGVPVNAILIALEEADVGVYWVELGKVHGFDNVGRSGDLAADVREGLARFGEVDNFPARMILFDGLADFEQAKQQLLSYSWEEKLPFLHIPKIESLGANIAVKAVAVAGGAEVAKSLGFQVSSTEELADSKQSDLDDSQTVESEKGESVQQTTKDVDQDSAEDFGFVEKDVLQDKQEKGESKEELSKQLEKQPKKAPEPTKSTKPLLTQLGGFFSGLGGVFNKRWLITVLAFLTGLGVVGGLLFFLYWNLPKAEVEIYVSPKVLEKKLSLSIALAEGENEEQLTGRKVEKIVSGKEKKQTSDKKLVGEKAKGKVTVYNKTEVKKTFPVGTVLVGNDNLKYLLDEQVSVASQSSELLEEGEKIVYGKSEAKIVAGSIGSEYNLSKDSEFSFQEYNQSQFSAEAETKISGGMSREVKAVSKKDRQALKEQLLNQLKKQAKEELRKKIGGNQEVIITDQLEVKEEEFSAEVDEQADQLTLDLKLALKGFVYNKKKLRNQLKKDFYELVPRGFTFNSSDISIQVLESKVEDEQIKLQVKAEAQLIPKIDLQEIKGKLAGKDPRIAKNYLSGLPNFVRAKIKLSPTLPKQIETMPYKQENISINLQVE